MPLPGHGFLAIWNDVASEHEPEWLRWHTREHMPERVGVPGFLAGRRYCDPSRSVNRYFTLYVGESLATFSSPPYLERLNNPTPWTRKTGPYFRNFIRGACRRVASSGSGVGGAIATLRVTPAHGAAEVDARRAQAMLDGIVTHDGCLAAHMGLADVAVTSVPTNERAARGAATEPVFHGVVLVEGLGRSELGRAMPAIGEAIAAAGLGLAVAETAIYDLSLALTKLDLA